MYYGLVLERTANKAVIWIEHNDIRKALDIRFFYMCSLLSSTPFIITKLLKIAV